MSPDFESADGEDFVEEELHPAFECRPRSREY